MKEGAGRSALKLFLTFMAACLALNGAARGRRGTLP
jgi:hypothetical protein